MRIITPPRESDWIQSLQDVLLMLLLVVATAYRFYGIDNAGLWGAELINAGNVVHTGWFSMVSSMIYKEIDPPGFITLIYLQYEILNGSEFGLRFLSAVAGVGSIWLLVQMGRLIRVPQAGLLAGTLLAGSFFAVSYSQEAQVYSIFTCVALWQSYLFLLLLASGYERASCLDAEGEGDLENSLASAAVEPDARPAMSLTWFRIVTLTMFMLGYVSIAILLGEMLACLLLANIQGPYRENATRLLRTVFLPVLGIGLLWLPVANIHLHKAWPLLQWGWLTAADTKDLEMTVLGYQLWLQLSLAAAIAGFFVFQVRQFLRKQTGSLESMLLAISVLVIVFVVVLVFSKCIMAWIQFRSWLLVVQPFLFLMAAVALFVPWTNRDADSPSGWVVVLVLIVIVFFAQIRINYSSGLFNKERKPDLRPAIQLLASDKLFMQGYRPVFMSNASGRYYLDRYGVNQDDKFIVQASAASGKAPIADYFAGVDFYYLDIVDSLSMKETSPMLNELLAQYRVQCLTRFDAVRLIKFEVASPVDPKGNIPPCKDIIDQELPMTSTPDSQTGVPTP